MITRALFFVILPAVLAACAHRGPAPRPSVAPQIQEDAWAPDFLDLEAGWRLRITTPLLKSGGYRLQAAGERGSGDTITLSTGDQLIGYETAFYTISKIGGGVRLEFGSAEMNREGQASPEVAATGWQPHLPSGPNFVRLLYLRRLSEEDHDMAIIAVNDKTALTALTREACKSDKLATCIWVPAGVAVVAEKRLNDVGTVWAPVQ